MFRTQRLNPQIADELGWAGKLAEGLKQREFLKGTVFEQNALQQGLDPYSLLIGVLIGIAATVIVGLFSIEIWLPRAIARVTGKTIEETARTVREILTG